MGKDPTPDAPVKAAFVLSGDSASVRSKSPPARPQWERLWGRQPCPVRARVRSAWPTRPLAGALCPALAAGRGPSLPRQALLAYHDAEARERGIVPSLESALLNPTRPVLHRNRRIKIFSSGLFDSASSSLAPKSKNPSSVQQCAGGAATVRLDAALLDSLLLADCSQHRRAARRRPLGKPKALGREAETVPRPCWPGAGLGPRLGGVAPWLRDELCSAQAWPPSVDPTQGCAAALLGEKSLCQTAGGALDCARLR